MGGIDNSLFLIASGSEVRAATEREEVPAEEVSGVYETRIKERHKMVLSQVSHSSLPSDMF